jgi:hypothetical protein
MQFRQTANVSAMSEADGVFKIQDPEVQAGPDV